MAAVVVHTNADGTTHTHGPTSAKIVALGTVTLAGATFMIDRDGQIEAGKTTEFGVEHIGGAAVEPTAAWIANPDGKKLCEPVKAEVHDNHCHMNVMPLYPVKKAAFVLQVGDEEAVVDVARGASPCNDGILSVFHAVDDPSTRMFLELKLHGDAGDLELWLYKSAGEQTSWQSSTGKRDVRPFDVPKETKITIAFQSHEGKAVELAIRNGDQNEDEEGVANMREAGTNYFIFPGDSGQDPEWLKGEDWRGIAKITFEVDGKSYGCDPFVLVPHEVL